jgi:hypothetical protein
MCPKDMSSETGAQPVSAGYTAPQTTKTDQKNRADSLRPPLCMHFPTSFLRIHHCSGIFDTQGRPPLATLMRRICPIGASAAPQFDT